MASMGLAGLNCRDTAMPLRMCGMLMKLDFILGLYLMLGCEAALCPLKDDFAKKKVEKKSTERMTAAALVACSLAGGKRRLLVAKGGGASTAFLSSSKGI